MDAPQDPHNPETPAYVMHFWDMIEQDMLEVYQSFIAEQVEHPSTFLTIVDTMIEQALKKFMRYRKREKSWRRLQGADVNTRQRVDSFCGELMQLVSFARGDCKVRQAVDWDWVQKLQAVMAIAQTMFQNIDKDVTLCVVLWDGQTNANQAPRQHTINARHTIQEAVIEEYPQFPGFCMGVALVRQTPNGPHQSVMWRRSHALRHTRTPSREDEIGGNRFFREDRYSELRTFDAILIFVDIRTPKGPFVEENPHFEDDNDGNRLGPFDGIYNDFNPGPDIKPWGPHILPDFEEEEMKWGVDELTARMRALHRQYDDDLQTDMRVRQADWAAWHLAHADTIATLAARGRLEEDGTDTTWRQARQDEVRMARAFDDAQDILRGPAGARTDMPTLAARRRAREEEAGPAGARTPEKARPQLGRPGGGYIFYMGRWTYTDAAGRRRYLTEEEGNAFTRARDAVHDAAGRLRLQRRDQTRGAQAGPAGARTDEGRAVGIALTPEEQDVQLGQPGGSYMWYAGSWTYTAPDGRRRYLTEEEATAYERARDAADDAARRLRPQRTYETRVHRRARAMDAADAAERRLRLQRRDAARARRRAQGPP